MNLLDKVRLLHLESQARYQMREGIPRRHTGWVFVGAIVVMVASAVCSAVAAKLLTSP